jgi:lipopolysaccharide transport system permease protein
LRADFLLELTRRRIVDRYIGTSSRIFWVLLSPLVPLLVNVAVFYFIAKIPQVQSMGLTSYVVFLFSGLLPFRIIQKAALESCDLLVGNMDMLKTAVFPLPFLSLSAVAALLVEFLVQCLFMIAILLAAQTMPSSAILLLPLALLILFTLVLGLSWVLSILNYGLRDLQEIMSLGFSMLLYVTPIIYPVDAVPAPLRILIRLNPLSSYVTIFRDSILPEQKIHYDAWIVAFCFSAASVVVGYWSIRKAQRFVGDMV